MRIVLISGKQGSGKSTLQKNLSESLFKINNLRTVSLNFADFIYEAHDFIINRLNEYDIENKNSKDGYLLQLLGTEWGRKTRGENIWVDILRGKIEKFKKLGQKIDVVIVGDCRFKNEFDAFPEALRVRLICDEEIRKKRVSMWRETTNHPSEIDLDSYISLFDMVLDTGKLSSNTVLELIGAQVVKNVWLEKRKNIYLPEYSDSGSNIEIHKKENCLYCGCKLSKNISNLENHKHNCPNIPY